MDNIVLVPVIILAILMAGIAGLVGYLLYRPKQKKKKLKPEGPVSSKYKDPPENGEVKVVIKDGIDGTMLPPYTKDEPEETKIDIEKPDQNGEDKRLLEVKVEPNERAVDVGNLDQKAPESSSDSDDHNKKMIEGGRKGSSSSSSSSEPPEVPARPDDLDEDDKGADRSTGPEASSSSEDVCVPQPMAITEPRTVRDPLMTKHPSDTDSDGLVSQVIAEVDGKKDSGSSSSSSDDESSIKMGIAVPVAAARERSGSSSSSSSDDDKIPAVKPRQKSSSSSSGDGKPRKKDSDSENIPGKLFLRDRPARKSRASDSSSSDDEYKQPPKPVKRKQKLTLNERGDITSSSSSSSSSSGELEVTPTLVVPVTAKKSSSSSSSSDSDVDKEDISTQTSNLPKPLKRRKGKKYPPPTPYKTKSSSSSSESGDDSVRKSVEIPIYASPAKIRKVGVEISTQTDKMSSSSGSSSSSSDSEIGWRGGVYPVNITSSSSERDLSSPQGQPRMGPRPFSPGRDGSISPIYERGTQTLFPPVTKKPKRTKSKQAGRPPSPVVITMVDKVTQMEASWSSSSSSSSDSEVPKSRIRKLYEKETQVTSSTSSTSSGDNLEITTRRQVTVTSTKRQQMTTTGTQHTELFVEKPSITSAAYGKTQHETKMIEVELQPEEHYKVEAIVNIPKPKKIIFTTSWGKPADLLDLYEAGIVDDGTKKKLESGELDPLHESVDKMVRPYISSNRPIGGILLESGKRISIYDAAKRGLIRRGTAVSLLEAEVANGRYVDPVSGQKMTVAEAIRGEFIDRSYFDQLQRAEKAVLGYPSKETGRLLSIYEAMNQGLIVHSHAIRLLQAQIATGGIIDPRANHRVPLEAAYRRRLFDRQLKEILENQSRDSKGFVDPNDESHLTYLELMSRCIIDYESEILLLPLKLKERGRPLRALSPGRIRSSTRIDMKSPSRSKSRERRSDIRIVKSSSSSQTSSSSESDLSRTKGPKEIKSSSFVIELSRSPVMSGDETTREISRVNFDVTSPARKFQGVHLEVDTTTLDQGRRARSRSRSRSSDEDRHMKSRMVETLETTTHSQTTEGGKTRRSSSSSSSSSDDEKEMNVRTGTKTTHTREEHGATQITTTIETITTTQTVHGKRRRSRQDIRFKSGWNRQASLADLFAAGVVTKETVTKLEEGTIEEEEVQQRIHQYLVGDEPIGGILVSETGEKISIYTAWRKGLIRRGTSISLLEAQAATGRILDPDTGKRMSVAEASANKFIDRTFESVLARAERAVYGYTTRLGPEILSLFQAMKRGIVVESHAIRLLEAQIATGGIIDPNANHRLPVEAAYERGLFDERMNQILEDPDDDTRGFFDPNTEENLTYLELMERCVVDKDTGMRLLPLRSRQAPSPQKKSKVVFESRTGRQVTLRDLRQAEVLDDKTATKFDKGEMTHEETQMMVAKLKVFVDGTMPIAGVISIDSGERISIYEAEKSGLLRRGTAFELLEAQACCGKIIDVQTGRVVTIETALRSGVIDREFKEVVERAHRAVTGYREPFKRELLSLCEAMNRHLVVRKHGIRLLEAQIATGGIIDLRSPVRINVQVALKRTLIDSKLADELERKLTRSYFDPVTGENLNYSELMGRCVTDKDTGLLYLMVEGGTVTGYVRPFEPEHISKIRAGESQGKLVTEEVTTKRSGMVMESKSVRKKKKKTRVDQSTSSKGEESVHNTSVLRRQVIIVDPETEEELSVEEALKRHLIDEDTAIELKARQGEWEESNA